MLVQATGAIGLSEHHACLCCLIRSVNLLPELRELAKIGHSAWRGMISATVAFDYGFVPRSSGGSDELVAFGTD